MDVGLHRALRSTEGDGDLGIGQSARVMEDDRSTLCLGDEPKRGRQRLRRLGVDGGVVRRPVISDRIDSRAVRLLRAARGGAGSVAAHVDGDRRQPRPCRQGLSAIVVEGLERAIGTDERVLGGVLGVGSTIRETAGDGEDRVLVSPYEVGEVAIEVHGQ